MIDKNKEVAELYYANSIAFHNAGEYLIRYYDEKLKQLDQITQSDKELIRPALYCKFISIELGLKAILIKRNTVYKIHDLQKLCEKIPELENFSNNSILKKIPEILELTRYIFDDPKNIRPELAEYMNGKHLGNRFNLVEFYEDQEVRTFIDNLFKEIDRLYSIDPDSRA